MVSRCLKLDIVCAITSKVRTMAVTIVKNVIFLLDVQVIFPKLGDMEDSTKNHVVVKD